MKPTPNLSTRKNEPKAIFYLPHIRTIDKICLGNITLTPYKKEEAYNIVMPNGFFDNLGTLIETPTFKSGDVLTVEAQRNITNAVEVLKFSFFSMSPSPGYDYPGFLSELTFDVFPLISPDEDTAFEHKIEISNGMSNFLFKLEDYYKSLLSANLTE